MEYQRMNSYMKFLFFRSIALMLVLVSIFAMEVRAVSAEGMILTSREQDRIPANSLNAMQDLKQLQKVENIIQQKMPNASVGIVLQDAKTGKVLYERRANENFLPASSTKLLTAAAMLYVLGSDYKYETSIKMNPDSLKKGTMTGDIYIKFSGDPSLTTADLKSLIKELKSLGINEIVGDIVIDNTRYQAPNYALGWSWNSLPWGFSAPVTTIILNENKVKLNITPSKTLGERAKLTIAADEITKLNISDDIISVSESDANERCQIMMDINSQNEVTAYGCWPAKDKTDTLKVALQNPNLLARQLIAETLKELKIKLSGQIAWGAAPNEVKTMASHHSNALSELLKPLLQDSNNIYADSFAKTLGAEIYNQGTFQSGVAAIKGALAKNLGLDVSSIRMQDGSGLSRYSVLEPNHLARVLYGMYHHRDFNAIFRGSLAVSGEIGTLKNRMSAFDLNGQVHGKTGGMIGTSSLAGYLTTRNKQDLIFVIMLNNAVQDAEELHNFENSLCELFATI